LGSREKVLEFLGKNAIDADVREFEESTKNSQLAAAALGCEVGDIAKSVVFAGLRPVVVVLPGDRRVDLAKLSQVAGGEVRRADPEFVRESTGYPIGGVPPFPHNASVLVVADASLKDHDWVWAAAGAPNAVFKVRAERLLTVVGRVEDVSEGPKPI
jgi:prolyl-tRNA editing enzyme YbaK/EbsC (Cys-tRNA(Pro) deacylase)